MCSIYVVLLNLKAYLITCLIYKLLNYFRKGRYGVVSAFFIDSSCSKFMLFLMYMSLSIMTLQHFICCKDHTTVTLSKVLKGFVFFFVMLGLMGLGLATNLREHPQLWTSILYSHILQQRLFSPHDSYSAWWQ